MDTPGHMDFLTEAYRSLSVLDGAVLVISAKDGVQAQTRILFHALQKMDIPTIIFINKIDQNGIDLRRVYQSIKDKLTSDMIVMQEVSLSPKITMTDISDLDKWDMIISGSDELLERYVAEILWIYRNYNMKSAKEPDAALCFLFIMGVQKTI